MGDSKKYLVELTQKISKALIALDTEMKKPSTVDRGHNIAKICNFLDSANDAAMHFGLGYGWKKINNTKK